MNEQHEITIGLDLAKSVFHVVSLDEKGNMIDSRKLQREELTTYFSGLPSARVAMEACATAHNWGRTIQKLGHRTMLLPPTHVKAYTGGRNKNDCNDALAIAEAAWRPHMREVAVKSEDVQDLQALHTLRALCVRQHTQLQNSLRSTLAERGQIASRGKKSLELMVTNQLCEKTREVSECLAQALAEAWSHLQNIEQRVEHYEKMISEKMRANDAVRRLMQVPGFGKLTASAFIASIGDGSGFRCGRDVAAWLGLTPKHSCSGGRTVMQGISKRGDKRLRSLLVQGARSALTHAEGKDDDMCRWALSLAQRSGRNKTAVALAAKMARIGWAVVAKNTEYQARHQSGASTNERDQMSGIPPGSKLSDRLES